MKNVKSKQSRDLTDRVRVFLLALCLVVAVSAVTLAADIDTGSSVRKLQNGSFEEGPIFTGAYSQPDQSAVPSWNTTAFQGKIELLKKNSGTYIAGVTVEPTDGTYAAELNADEESTLYQVVNTTPSSVYEWGLDHGARNGKDIMALVIGPNQSVNPSKPSKDGRDHFMQMVDWLNSAANPDIQNKISTIESGEKPLKYTVYSKKFAADGTFDDNAGNNAFSLTPSTIYTEEWHIWIMASAKATSGTNPWNSYGSNAEGSAGSGNGSGSTTVDLSKYYLYTVPAGQTETLFGFVSVGYKDSPVTGDKAKTYGNFLDNINFQLYHVLSGSTSTHGSAVVGGSDGTAGGEGGSSGHTVTVDGKLTTYITDGQKLKIQAVVKKTDVDDGCEFVGVYHTQLDDKGNPVTTFIKLAENEIEDDGSLTDEQKAGKWIKSTNSDGDIIYTYYLNNVSSATDLHFVFIKSPTITYDPNGGKAYVVDRTYNKDEAANVYSFKPASGHNEAQAGTGTIFIDPYVSLKAQGQNDGWKFMGWKLTGDTVDSTRTDLVNKEQLGSLLLPAVHTIACDYTFVGEGGDTKAQYFKIYNGNVPLAKSIDTNAAGEATGVTWTDSGETKVYANVHKGLTLVAQWRWLQAFIPQVRSGSDYTDSANGGTVEITSVANKSDENYNAAYNANGGKSYHAETDETITVKASAKAGYTFEGWYDAKGNLVTTSTTLSYTETKEAVNTYYARFAGSVTQTYIRQVKNGDNWEVTTDDNIGTLGRYTYTDAPGTPISSTATAKSGYKFVGWYDSTGNKVADSMLINGGTTISYTTGTSNATYYARFETTYTVKFVAQTQYPSSLKTETTWGSVSPTTVTDVAGAEAKSTATPVLSGGFLGWYDGSDATATKLSDASTYTPKITTTNNVTYYARFAPGYTVNFVAQTKQADGTFTPDTSGGKVSTESATGLAESTANSTATANSGYKFLGWYDKNGNQLSTNAAYSTTTTSATNNVTYYARFESNYTASVGRAYVSFVSENKNTLIPDAFSGRDAGIHKNTERYGQEDKFGNTIATGFKYSIDNMTNVSTIQITVTVPASAYVKVGGTGSFTGNGTSILTDSTGVKYNKGSIQQISGATTLTYYWDASGLQANTEYGFIIDNLYAPGATAIITVNGTSGTKVINDNGVVNTASGEYRGKSHYPK